MATERDPADQLLAEASEHLLNAVGGSLEGWVELCFLERAPDRPVEAGEVAAKVASATLAELSALFAVDSDGQRRTPLQIVRDQMEPVTAALRSAGVVAPGRHLGDERIAPSDPYGLGPAAWADLGEAVGEAGLRWGAAKAMVHLRRHRTDVDPA